MTNEEREKLIEETAELALYNEKTFYG